MDKIPCAVEQDLRAYYRSQERVTDQDYKDALDDIEGEMLSGCAVDGLIASDFIIEEMHPSKLAKLLNDVLYGNSDAKSAAEIEFQKFASEGLKDWLESVHYNYIETRAAEYAEGE